MHSTDFGVVLLCKICWGSCLVFLSKTKQNWLFIACYNYLKKGCGNVGLCLFSQKSSVRMTGNGPNGLKLYQGIFRLAIRKSLFI